MRFRFRCRGSGRWLCGCAALQKLADLGAAATIAFGAILDFGQQLQNEFSAYPDFLSQIDFGQVARRLLDESVIQFVAVEFPQIYNLLVLLGLFELSYESPFPGPAHNATGFGPELTEYEPIKSKQAFLRRSIRDGGLRPNVLFSVDNLLLLFNNLIFLSMLKLFFDKTLHSDII